jgi:cobyrinic acid a,c-diamide synthase
MESLRQQRAQVQGFLSQACFAGYHGMAAATGLNPRHLDSWLMSPALCREIFSRATENCDLAVVEGRFGSALAGRRTRGGSLEPLCCWLDLPRIVVLDVSRLASWEFPERPQHVDALLLDGVANHEELSRLKRNLEAIWAVPVLGALERVPGLRADIRALPLGSRPSHGLLGQLAARFSQHSRPMGVLELALRHAWAGALPAHITSDWAATRMVVAVAYDSALNCYFPDALDLLESYGATVVDFSPLRDEQLPPGTDIVYLGCGRPDRYAAQLSQNHCMKLALRNHLRQGGRIYAEGGGLAYLCQRIETGPGRSRRMVGVFPATARFHQDASLPAPVELTVERGTWLGRPGARLRGYYNSAWRLKPAGALTGCVVEPRHRYSLVKSSRAVGSLLHLDFAALGDLLGNFLHPCPLPSTESTDPWSANC